MTSACGSLQDANIGSVTGSATYDACDSDTISISANNVPSATADKQYSVQREVCGDGEVIVKVLSVSGGLAGLELRASNAPGAIKVGLRTALGTSVQRFVRTSTDGSQSSNNTSALGHKWLKLVRSGSNVSTYTSTNGSTWNFAASYTISLPTCVQASLLMQSVNVGTTHTGVFKDLQFSSFTLPAGDTTTVAFDQDTISANAGDTVMICVNIDNPCDCSPTEVDVELQGSGSPHLSAYSTQNLVFDDTTSQKCFSLPINGAWGDHIYTLSLENISGGNGAEADDPGELVIVVDGETPPVPFCGVLDSIAFDSSLSLEIGDRFGNAYPLDYIRLPEDAMGGGSRLTSFPACGCDEFDISTGYFNIYFEDCIYTETGFNDPVFGADRRQVVCQVFSEIAEMIALQTTGTCEGELQEVNVRILPSQIVPEIGQDNVLNAEVLGVGSPYERISYGLRVGFPWLIINAADVPVTLPLPDIYHGTIRINFEGILNTSYWYELGSGPSSSSGLTDLYTVVWHEALHMLDFRSRILNGIGAYTLYDQHLRFVYPSVPGTPLPIIEETPGQWPFWDYHSVVAPSIDFFQSCQDAQGIDGPDIHFAGNNGNYPVLSNSATPQLTSQSHSHLNANCDGSTTDDYLMSGFLLPEVRRLITADEIDIMCALGYQMGMECECTVAGVEDFGPDCETTYEVEMCDDLTIYVEDLIANDHPDVSGISELFLLTPLYGELTWQSGSSSYLFEPARPGLVVLGYHPVGCDGKKGNFTYVYVRVKVSEECAPTTDCEVVYDCENEPIFPDCISPEDPFCDKSSFCNNILCNPGFCDGIIYGNTFGFGVIDPPFMSPVTNSALLPGWYRSHGTPDLFLPTNSSLIRLGANDFKNYSEGVWSLLTEELIEGNYLFGVYLKAGLVSLDVEGTLTLHADLVEANELQIPGNQSILPPYGGTNIELLTFSTDIAVNNVMLANCIEINPSNEDALRLYLTYAVDINQPEATALLDYVEFMKDGFYAGEDTTVVECPDTVLLGGNFCMLSGVTIRYQWFELDENDDPILPAIAAYTVLNNAISNVTGDIDLSTYQLMASPFETTTYRLVRTIQDYGDVDESFELCTAWDDVTVTVDAPQPDASFTYDEEDCLWCFTSTDNSEGLLHYWTFGVPGPTSEEANPCDLMLSDGEVIVTHIVATLCARDTFIDTLIVTACCEFPFPTADYDVGALVDSCGVYRFRINSTSEGVNSILWNVNGTTSTLEEFDYTFPTSGTFPYSLTVTNLCGQVRVYSDSIEVKIRDASFTPSIFCLNTYFEPAYTIGGTHSWIFGDGNTSTVVSPQHTYEEGGSYTVIHQFTDTICDRVSADTLMITLVECDTTGFDCPCDSPYNIDASMLDDGEVLLSTLINTGTLPAVYLANTCLALNGRLIVDVDYTFLYIEGRMHSGAEIVVQPSATLALNSVTRDGGLHGCEEMWRGIRVFGSGGGLLRSKGSLISDAQYAVHALDKSTIDIQGTTFSRNFVGIFFELAPGVEGSFELLPFHNNTFDGAEDLLLPYDGQAPEVGDRPFAGISITNCAEPIHIGVTAAGVNTFRDIHNGILTFNTPLLVERSVFENVVEVNDEPEYAFTGFGVRHQGGAAHLLTVIGLGDELTDDASFSNCTNAIWGIGTNANITENNMENVVTGVRLEFCTQRTLTVVDNRINAIFAGVDLFQNAPAASISVLSNNIYMNEGNGALGAGTAIRVEENTLPHPASSAVIDDNRIIAYGWYDQGIRLSSASAWDVISNSIKLEGVEPSAIGINVLKGSDNEVRNNTVHGPSGGFGINVNGSGNVFLECNVVQNLGWGLNLVGDNAGADVATTLFVPSLGYGLRYTNGVMAPIQDGRGNVWEGAAGDYDGVAAVHEGVINTDIQSTAYRVLEEFDPMAGANHRPPSIAFPNAPLTDPEDWFQDGVVAAIVCTTLPQYTDGEEQLKLARRLAKDSMDHFPAGTVWDAKWELYEKLLKNPGLMSEDTVLSDFFDATELTTLGELVAIEQAKSALFEGTTETEAILVFAGQLDSLIHLIQELDSVIVADSLTVIPSNRAEWMGYAHELVDSIQQLSQVVDSLRLLEIEELIEANDEITATTRQEKNQRTVNKLYLDVLAKGSLTFTESEQDTLAFIAEQCPQIGGRAVFVARAMRAYFSDATHVETEPCVDSISMLVAPQAGRILPQEVLIPQQEEESTVKIFPNPAGDYFMLSYDLNLPGQVQLYDLYGRVRLTQALYMDKRHERISTTHLETGVYIVMVTRQDGSMHNLRLLITR